jgi:predicted acyl esterase
MIVERDVPVPMSDGITLRVNVFRPEGVVPVVMSMTAYGKDNAPDRIGMLAMRAAGVRFGHLNCSRLTGFESPDPQFWVDHGYAVVQGDTRGMHASEGTAGFLTDRDAHDYAEVIAWAAAQSWCTGAVGLNGVSYLCMSQWRVAALRPPSLKAIVAWEGASDLLREFAYHGGIPETGFLPVWWKNRMLRGSHGGATMGEDFLTDARTHPLDDGYWQAKRPDVGAIDVPALVAAGWADHGLHTRGTLLAYEALRGPKWLCIHGGRKWETYYRTESLDLQRRFLDRFLKGTSNGFEDRPAVTYQVRRSREVFQTRTAADWPPPEPQHRTLYLDAASMSLIPHPPAHESCTTYASRRHRRGTDRARFAHRFAVDTEIVGSMALSVWMSTDDADDADVFVVIRKRDAAGNAVGFYGYNGYRHDAAAKGWLRASRRELDPVRSLPNRPFQRHARAIPVSRGVSTRLDIEIWPSATLFEAGTELVADILGHDANRYPALRHRDTVNSGTHTIHTGPATPSTLVFNALG